ncbi:MAG: hypothetical protein Q8P39_03260 [Candidatus Yanofskybacteria bacterium]|nr:hypothetical protein [Candidatus Yanofskybacteria bacterium]
MTVVEILVATAIATVVFVSVLGGTIFILQQAKTQEQRGKALALAQEGLEAVRSFRDATDWNEDGIGTKNTGVSFMLLESGSPARWELVQGTESIDEYTREIIFEQVRRDGGGNIVEEGGAVDEETKKARVRVFWDSRGATYEVEVASLFANWRQ